MAANSLQAVLDRAAKSEPAAPVKTQSRAAKPKQAAPAAERTAAKPGRASTKLIGGHFAPEISTQLRIIAAEEGTTVQNLLAEALDDLFVKKGKARLAKR